MMRWLVPELAILNKRYCSCAPSPPPAPNYVEAAKQQGAENVNTAIVQGKINNPNVVSPYGTQTVTWKDGKPTITQAFSPEQQDIYEQSNRVKQLLGGLGEQGATALQGVVGKELDLSGAPSMPGTATDTRNKVIDSMMSRVNQDTAVAKDSLHSELIAAGIRPGSKAYDDRMHLVDRSYNDARNQAFLASGQEASRDFGLDSERRRQAIMEILSQRQVPLNEITALMSGSQVSNPFTMPGAAQNTQVQPAPLFAAQNALAGYNTDIYNAQAAQAGNLQQGLFGLGGAGIMGGGMALSDRRLKTNVRQVGNHPVGVPLYEYDIMGVRERGVMADELEQVRPDAVAVGPDGYQMVNYALIGGRDGLH